jgi:hypothetical protein
LSYEYFVLFVGLFHCRQNSSSPSTYSVEISDSKFDEIISTGSAVDGGVIFFQVYSYDKIYVKNCTFEFCMGATRGGVFYLFSNTVSINLEKVKLLFNTATTGSDIYCANKSCSIIIATDDTVTCSTNDKESAHSLTIPLTVTLFDHIKLLCTDTNPCVDETDTGKCKTSCVRF